MSKLEQPRFPIGYFQPKENYTIGEIRKDIKTISIFPKALKKAFKKVSKNDVNKQNEVTGLSLREIVNHLVDSHLNGYVRMKLTVTEQTPVVKTYEEEAWALTSENNSLSPKASLKLLDALHERWVAFMSSLAEADLNKGYFHPEQQRIVFLSEAIAFFAHQCEHYLAQILNKNKDGNINDGTTNTNTSSPKPRRGRPRKVDSQPIKVPGKRGRPKSTSQSESTEKSKPAQANKTSKAQTSQSGNLAVVGDTQEIKVKGKRGRPKGTVKAGRETAPKLTRSEALAKARQVRAKKLDSQKASEPIQSTARKRHSKSVEKSTLGTKLQIKQSETNAVSQTEKKLDLSSKNSITPTGARKRGRPKGVKNTLVQNQPKLTKTESLARARAVRAQKLADKIVAEAPSRLIKRGRPKKVKSDE